MSAYEALRALRNKVPWLTNQDEEGGTPPAPPTPIEEAEILIALAKMPGQIDRQSGTWSAVARWAAAEVIIAQRALESAEEKAPALRARIRTLRDLLEIDERGSSGPQLLVDQGPDVP